MTDARTIHRLRQAVARQGLTPASWIPEASEGRSEEASIRPARLVEGDELAVIPVGPAEAWPGPVAFLDGTQRYDIVAHHGAAPLVIARIAAAVRERNDRRLKTVEREVRLIAVARPSVLKAAGEVLDGVEQVALEDDEPVHPVRDLMAVRRAVDRERGRLEIEVGERYRQGAADGTSPWLIVDGTLTSSADWARDPRTIGIVKSHAVLPFEGEELERYLRLPAGFRSSVFAPPSSRVAPVYSWALRLWPWEGHDLFHGLIRVEARPASETLAEADRISRFLLAERAPLSAPDARWDRLLYGFRTVEELLRVVSS